MPDARKSLRELRAEWIDCQRCSLGVTRAATGGAFLFGAGMRRGMLFVGEGPGWQEEKEEDVFGGPGSELLVKVLTRLGMREYYLTNSVCCRSCSQVLDDKGVPVFKQFGRGPKRPMYRDDPPLPVQMLACRPRLLEEIYLVDPVLIVSLGPKAAETLLGSSISITTERGKERYLEVPGATNVPVLTEKNNAWARRVKGKFIMPTKPNPVRYLLLPTYAPSYVLRKISDKHDRGPFGEFASDIQLAVKIYERYLMEAHGIMPSGASSISDADLLADTTQKEEDPDE